MKTRNGHVVGAIAVLPTFPRSRGRLQRTADDSSLGALLESLAHCDSLADEGSSAPLRLVASARLSWFATSDGCGAVAIRADLARLVEDLESEYDRLAAI